MVMFIDKVLIEVRPNLQCANVFLCTVSSLSEINEKFKIIVNAKEIIMSPDKSEKQIIILPNLVILPNSLTSLCVKDKNISFRVLLQPENLKLVDISKNGQTNSNIKLCPAIKTDSQYNFVCSNCSTRLFSKTIKFKRILELPSDNTEIGDWFCHNDGHKLTEIVINLEDIFFGLYFIVINKENLTNYTVMDTAVYCKKCLELLGELCLNQQGIKLWNDSVHAQTKENDKLLIFNDLYEKTIDNIIKKTLNNFSWLSEIHSKQFLKILIEAVYPNRRTKFLMLTVVETKLHILLNTSYSNSSNLESKTTLKILFKTENNNDTPLLNYWKSDISVQNVILSYKSFNYLINLLDNNSQIIPEKYRYSNGFILTYFWYL